MYRLPFPVYYRLTSKGTVISCGWHCVAMGDASDHPKRFQLIPFLHNIRSVFRALSLLFSAVWVGFYVLLWLLMHMSCELGFPSNCRRSYEPMDVLIELPFLLAFALGQVSHETTRSAIYSVDITCTDSTLSVVRLVCVTCAFHRFWCQPGIHRRNDARSCFLLLYCSLGTHSKTLYMHSR